MEQKIKAAVAARASEDVFIIARTDAREPEGLDKALQRAERYVKAGADGIYIEAPTSEKELEHIGKWKCCISAQIVAPADTSGPRLASNNTEQ